MLFEYEIEYKPIIDFVTQLTVLAFFIAAMSGFVIKKTFQLIMR